MKNEECRKRLHFDNLTTIHLPGNRTNRRQILEYAGYPGLLDGPQQSQSAGELA
jgi:hypothetical protein